MDQVNILGNDRDYTTAGNVIYKKEDKQVKLTENSRTNVASRNGFLKRNILDLVERLSKFTDKYYDENRKTLKLKEFMKNNVIVNKLKRLGEYLSEKLNVSEVNVPNVDKLFAKSNKNDNDLGLDMNALDEEIRKSKEESEKPMTDIVEEKAEVENNDSFYSYKKSDIVQDNIYSEKTTSMEAPDDILERNNATDDDIAQNNINSESSVPFSKFEGDSISDEIPMNTSFTYFNKNLSSISENIDGENYTIKDLEVLRSAIEQERKTQEELKNRLENQRIEKENAEKEAKEAEREKEAKIKFANEQLAAYRAENQKLKNQQIEVEQETQRKLSARQAAMNQIAEINQMLAGGNLNNSIVNSNRRGK